MSDLELLELPRVLREARQVIEKSVVRGQFEHRMEIFGRLLDVISSDMGDSEKLATIIADFDLFCVVFVRLDDIMPMFPAKWQSEVQAIIEEKTESLFIECRKIGKSALLSSYAVWKMVNSPGERAIVFAPTSQQLLVMEDIYKIIGRNSFLMDKYVGRGTYGKEHIRFAANESEVKSSNLALAQDADTKRGEKGSLIIVDEIELIPESIRNFVIDDMMADAYTDKKMIMVGTPKDVANPNLEKEWDEAQVSDLVGTHHMDMWDGVRQGCISKEYVSIRFRRLRIPCPWGLFRGECGKRWYPDQEYRLVADEPEYWDGWQCDEICLHNESFVAENMGEFPSIAGKFFPKDALLACGDIDLVWEVSADPGAQYVIGVDYGLLMNPTQIVVFKVLGDVCRLVYWHEMMPVEPQSDFSGGRSYDPVVKAVKEAYHRFCGPRGNQVRWLFVDATQPGLQVTHDLTKGASPVPGHRIWSNETAEKKDIKGVWFTGQYKDMMMQNYKKMMMEGRVLVPKREPFWSQFMIEHENVKVEPTGGGNSNYLKYQPPKGNTIDLIVAMALGALIGSKEVISKGPFVGYAIIGDRRPRSRRRMPNLTEDINARGLFES